MKKVNANSVYPIQTLLNAASDHGLRLLHKIFINFFKSGINT